MPEPPGLVVKNGTNRFAVFDSPGPSSRDPDFQLGRGYAPADCTPPPVSQRRIRRVAEQIDQHLVELIGVALYG